MSITEYLDRSRRECADDVASVPKTASGKVSKKDLRATWC